ncbi:MAG: hypothetical protein ACT4PP_06345 [Sporichthyaceae bacterium]
MELTRAGRFVAWGNAVLAGLVSPDLAAERIRDRDGVHRIVGADTLVPSLAGAGGTGAFAAPREVSLTVLLAGLRGAGVTGLLLALPVPGDPFGLPGPAAFNARALEAGEAVLTLGERPHGFVPSASAPDPDGPPPPAVRWGTHVVEGNVGWGMPTLAEAERTLNETLRAVTETLIALDIARADPAAAAVLGALRADAGSDGLAPGYPGRAHRVHALACRVQAIAALAATGPGAAVSAAEMTARADCIRPLAAAARRAQVAALNSVAATRAAGSPQSRLR